jgi:hypothetical protein
MRLAALEADQPPESGAEPDRGRDAGASAVRARPFERVCEIAWNPAWEVVD